jgi:hypothetical protein
MRYGQTEISTVVKYAILVVLLLALTIIIIANRTAIGGLMAKITGAWS